MELWNNIRGTIYFFYYGTIGYITDYEKHLLWRKECNKQWSYEHQIVK